MTIPADKAGEHVCPWRVDAATPDGTFEFAPCYGPRCMAWWWKDAEPERKETKTDEPPSGDGWLFYSRRHDGWHWARPRTPTHGRCGRVP